MFSSIGHDLRTPLTALRAAVEALIDGVAPDPDRYLRSMLRDVEALSALIDDLFLLSRIEAGRLDLDRRPLDLSELIDEAVEALTPAAAARHVDIELDVDGSGAGDAATPRRSGGSCATCSTTPSSTRRRARRSASRSTAASGRACGSSTTGPGFPADFTDRAFERFTRADESRTRASGGAGLGLAIARGLVEAHGGHIWIEQPPGGRVVLRPAALTFRSGSGRRCDQHPDSHPIRAGQVQAVCSS